MFLERRLLRLDLGVPAGAGGTPRPALVPVSRLFLRLRRVPVPAGRELRVRECRGVSHGVKPPALPAQADPELPGGLSPWSQTPWVPPARVLWQLVDTCG